MLTFPTSEGSLIHSQNLCLTKIIEAFNFKILCNIDKIVNPLLVNI